MFGMTTHKRVTPYRYEGFFLHLFVITLLQISVSANPTTIVEKAIPLTEGHHVYIWPPQPDSTRTDKIWFMTKQSGTNITMTASIRGGCKKCTLTGRTENVGIKQTNKWYELKLLYTAKYGASTIKIEGDYFYPRRQNKEVPPTIITFDSTSDIYWTKLDPEVEPFFQQSSVPCPSTRSEDSGIQTSSTGVPMKITVEDGLELDLIIKTEVNIRKSKEEPTVAKRQSMDPSSYITYQEHNQEHSYTEEEQNQYEGH